MRCAPMACSNKDRTNRGQIRLETIRDRDRPFLAGLSDFWWQAVRMNATGKSGAAFARVSVYKKIALYGCIAD